MTVAPAPILDRASLLQAMDVAASAFAAGQEVAGASLAGRRFVVRQAFGCGGPAVTGPSQAGLATVTWSEDRESAKLALTPGDWSQSALIAGDAETWEAAEGFWLARPWLRVDTCPAVQGSASPEAPSAAQTMGLAAVFKEGGARTVRRNGRAYEATLRPDGDQPLIPSAQGYRLVLEGRMTAFADGRAIRCRAADADQRPICIGAVQLDRVAFEDAEGKTLSEWREG
ncbi:hypothetical protein [uncultured Brevundimonas sp.]|uniref:hypothetical protein n=1 Tax=uncultured Brevundimonas sp. TaxID=213418 RepID=UPI0025FCA204|nr:hypothetical protein [uncultured Brevundimonas sp.]